MNSQKILELVDRQLRYLGKNLSPRAADHARLNFIRPIRDHVFRAEAEILRRLGDTVEALRQADVAADAYRMSPGTKTEG